MRISIAVTAIAFAVIAQPALAQQRATSPLSKLEKEILARIAQRAISPSGFRFDSAEFDVRLPLKGEPEEIIGPTTHAADALAVGSARIEPLDSIASRSDTFRRARYDLRIEDRRGNCLIVHQQVTFDSVLVRGPRSSESCRPLYMADVVRRARRIARIPVSAGRLNDDWSVALAAIGTADVYMDSVVITTSSLALRAVDPVPATAIVSVDSVSAGLGMGETSWNVVRQSPAIRVDTTLHKGGEWHRGVRRFVIPIDSTFDLKKSWPLFQVHVHAPVTPDNPSGLAWTYAHARRGFFSNLPKDY